MEEIKTEKRTILIVDDNPQNIQLAASHLKEEGYRIAFSQHGRDALEKVRKNNFDLILLDIMMPEMDGFEICRRIKELTGYGEVPIIFLTAKTDKESIVRGFEEGAVDYVVKPFFGAELRARVRTHLKIKAYQEELQMLNKRLYDHATKDPLTGLFNRRKMIDSLEYEKERTKRGDSCYSVIICDIDHFKKINDTYGHDCGDEILKQVATIFTDTIRKQDQLARWGGEEFLILLPDTDEQGAVTLSEKIRRTIEEREFSCPELSIRLTMTFGIGICTGEKDPDRCIKEADIALYHGKTGGRNRTMAFRDEQESVPSP